MQISVSLFATFRAGRFNEAHQEVEPGTRIADIVAKLGIPESKIGIVLLDARHAEFDQELHDGAHLSLFPFIGGG